METKNRLNDNWHKIDNAGLIYPSAGNEQWNNVFRVSAYLKSKVDEKILQQALNIVIERFPSFDVTLRRGMFWYYFQNITQFPTVEKEVDYPCRRMELNQKKHLFRVLYFENKISFETFHSLTDGTGAVCFLNALLACYFNLQNEKIDEKKLVVNYKDRPNCEEVEDSFKRYADDSGKNKRDSKKAYQVYGTPEPNGKLNVITAVMDAQKLNEIAKQHKATITEFLVSIYAKSILIREQASVSHKKPVVISVPINLRKFFATSTLRNFSSWIDIYFEYKCANYNIDELIDITKNQMKVISKEYLLKNINTNVATEKNIFVRLMPLFIKNFALNLSYKLFGESAYTSVVTNLGKISTPPEFNNLVDRYDCLLSKSILNTVNIAVATFNNKLSITFTDCIMEHNIERDFCRMLKTFGIDITIFTNIE